MTDEYQSSRFFPPTKPDEQEWEKFRSRVGHTQSQSDDGHLIERRVLDLERRLNSVEIMLTARLEQMASHYQHMASVLDTMQKTITQLVTRVEFAPIKFLVYALCASLLAGVVGAALSRLWIK